MANEDNTPQAAPSATLEALRAWKEFQEASDVAEKSMKYHDGMEATAAYERAEKALNAACASLASPTPSGPGTVADQVRGFANYLRGEEGEGSSPVAPTCAWKNTDPDGSYWETSCGRAWTFPEGDVKENQVKFCVECGKTVVDITKTDDEDDETLGLPQEGRSEG